MNKSVLAKSIVEKSQYKINVSIAKDLINCFIDVVQNEIANGNEVRLTGFGIFECGYRSERIIKNPQTGEPLTIPACNVPKFKPGKAFKNALK